MQGMEGKKDEAKMKVKAKGNARRRWMLIVGCWALLDWMLASKKKQTRQVSSQGRPRDSRVLYSVRRKEPNRYFYGVEARTCLLLPGSC